MNTLRRSQQVVWQAGALVDFEKSLLKRMPPFSRHTSEVLLLQTLVKLHTDMFQAGHRRRTDYEKKIVNSLRSEGITVCLLCPACHTLYVASAASVIV